MQNSLIQYGPERNSASATFIPLARCNTFLFHSAQFSNESPISTRQGKLSRVMVAESSVSDTTIDERVSC